MKAHPLMTLPEFSPSDSARGVTFFGISKSYVDSHIVYWAVVVDFESATEGRCVS